MKMEESNIGNGNIVSVSVHHVGNKVNADELILSKKGVDLADFSLQKVLMKFFLESFEWQEFYNFSFSNDEVQLNPLYNFCGRIFQDKHLMHAVSEEIAVHLFETANHPQIKNGDLLVGLFENVLLEDELVDVVGIFKSENKQGFLNVEMVDHAYKVKLFEGIQLDKLDKACLVFNTHKEEGYKVVILDRSNKVTEAQYWKEQFLNVRPCADAYHFTKDFMSMTKNYITKQLPKESEVNKSEQVDLLNRSLDYFKTKSSFNKEEFEDEVFQDPVIIESFQRYEPGNNRLSPMDFDNDFDISKNAVNKQSKVYKSIIKLDKNFHIYVHGDRELIEQGRDPDGRKYYKIYFSEES